MQKVLIIGASSFLGSALASALGPDSVILASRSGAAHHQFDAATPDIEPVLRIDENISHCVISYGITRLDEIALSPEETAKVNVEATIRVVDQLIERKVIPVYLSSDAVLGDASGPQAEDVLPAPLVSYGAQKVEVENYVMAHAADHLIVRVSKVYELSRGDQTLLTALAEKLTSRRPFKIADDYRFNPIYRGDVVQVLIKLLQAARTGLYHLGGPDIVTYYSLMTSLAEAMELRPGKDFEHEICPFNDFMKYEKRALDSSLASNRLAKDAPHNFLGIDEACRRVAEQYEATWATEIS